MKIEVSKIYPHPQNPRGDLGDLSELIDSIKAKGVLQNLTVVPKNEDWTEFTVVIGHRRLEAAKQAGLTEVPCTFAKNLKPSEQIQIMLMENMQREDLTVYEQAQGFQLMLDTGHSYEHVAKETGFSQSTIRRRVKLLELDPVKFKETEARNVSLEDYARLDGIKDIERKNKVLEFIGTNDFEWKLKNAITEEEEAIKKDKICKKLSEFAIEVDDERARDLKTVSWIYALKDVEAPEDVEEVQYYFCRSGYTVKLAVEYEEEGEDDDEEEISEEELQNQRNLEQLMKKTELMYELREKFTSEIKPWHWSKKIYWVADFLTHVLLDCNTWLNDERKAKIDKAREGSDNVKTLIQVVFYKVDFKGYGYCDSWKGKYKENKELDRVYDLLIELGYELSEEEQQLKDGTHELYRR